MLSLQMLQDLFRHITMDLGHHEDDIVGLKHIDLTFLAQLFVDMFKKQVPVLEDAVILTLLMLQDARQDLVRCVRQDCFARSA